ncbi:MAG: YdbH domain-containing protein [Candidatus Aminicenantes bacterium]|nr:YdbH domain-containing protein [Candidatus Aminicenantes bacterium]
MGKRQAGKKQRSRKRIIITRIFWATFFVLAIAFLIFLPAVVESLILNRLEKMGFVNSRLNVRGIGLNKLDINSVTVGDPENPDIEIPVLFLDFSLPGLLKGKVKKIEISGMKFSLNAGDDGVRLKGLKVLPGQGGAGGMELPFTALSINSSILNLTWRGKKIMIPFDFRSSKIEVEGDPDDKKGDTFAFSGRFFPYGEQISVSGAVNMAGGIGNIIVKTDLAKIHRYFDDFPAVVPLFFESTGRLRSEILLDSWKIAKGHVFAAAESLKITLPGVNVSCDLSLDFNLGSEFTPKDILFKVKFNSIDNKELRIDLPLVLNVGGENLDTLKFKLVDFKLKEPAGVKFKNISGTISGLPGKLTLTGIFSCEALHRLIPGFFPGIKTEGSLDAAGDFRIDLTGTESKWEIKGKGRGNMILSSSEASFRLDNLSLFFSISSAGKDMASEINLSAEGARLEYDSYVIHAKKIVSENRILGNSVEGQRVSGSLKLMSTRITSKDGLQAEGVNLDFPYRFPFLSGKSVPGRKIKAVEPGSFNIKKLQIAELVVGKIAGDIKQDKVGLDLSGEILSPLKDLGAHFTGTFRLVDTEPDVILDIRADRREIDADAKFGAIHPALTGNKISGFLSASANFSIKMGEFRSSALLKLENGSLETLTGSVKCSGIDAGIKMSDLAAFTSEFSQQVSFTGLDIGGLKFNGGTIVFHIENPEMIFVEEGEFVFCDGKVLVNPFRYEIGKEDFEVTLFCDRIDFDKMVNIVMGKEVASGDAELNGILPVKISGGIPIFRDGYLYSTPGVVGNVKFKDSKVISGGVLLVEEAMKDFNYDWIKLRLNTLEEKLNMVVLINGTPAHKLPLTYDAKSKDIVRDKKGKPRMTLKGLLLELRLKDIDLKELLQGGSKIYSIRKKKGEEK